MAGITITPDSGTQFEAGAAEYNSVDRLGDNDYIVAYRDNNDGNKGKINVGSRTGTSISISEANAVVFNNASTDMITIRALSSSLVIISYRNVDSKKPYVVAATISGTTITLGTPVMVINSAINYGITVASLGGVNFVVSVETLVYLEGFLSYVGSISGTTITLGSAQQTSSAYFTYQLSSVGLDSTHFAVIMNKSNVVAVVAGVVDLALKTITFGAVLMWSGDIISGNPNNPSISAFDSTHFITGHIAGGSTDFCINAYSVDLSTLVITRGVQIVTGAGTDKSNHSLCAITSNNFLVAYYTTTGTQAEIRGGTLSGSNTINWDDQGAVIFDNGLSAYTALCRLTDDYFIVGYKSG